ncbi:erg28 protein [Malassezia pachydermatis]|uniref:Erg28 protein n=1 Tax=Malassezia pachydermatis TaxID=77020 RepID=A0A0M8MWZ0_9BASI|nr:erg28 protein [Malassezia pachydermatis]KOS15470.1 erg28 protein [Malassezia pachydermatis]
MNDWLPPALLPKWLLLVGAVAALNGAQNFMNPVFSRKVYASKTGHKEATALAARLFAIWNWTSAIVRLYTAYNMHERGAYLLCLGTFVIACVHFVSEMLFFGTLALAPGSLSPIVVAIPLWL